MIVIVFNEIQAVELQGDKAYLIILFVRQGAFPSCNTNSESSSLSVHFDLQLEGQKTPSPQESNPSRATLQNELGQNHLPHLMLIQSESNVNQTYTFQSYLVETTEFSLKVH